MVRHGLVRLLSVAVFTIGLGAPLAAEECPDSACRATNVASVTVGTILRLALDGTTTVTASPTQAAYDVGYQALPGPRAVVKSNQAWRLQISVADQTWTPQGAGARTNKPAADLSWSTSPEDGFTPLAILPADVASGHATRGTSLDLFYRTRFDRTRDNPGTYSLVVRLTLVGA